MNRAQKLVVIIPALNEEKTIRTVIEAIPRTQDGISTVEVVVINDGSSDGTKAEAIAAGAHVVSHDRPMGVGAAFHTGIKQALRKGADVIVNIDADGQFDPKDIPTLISPVLLDQADFVTTTRFADSELMPQMPGIKKWGNEWVARIVNVLTGKKFTDVSCGFRAYSREAALRLTLFGHFTYTQETFIDLVFKNMRILEVPLKIRGEREHGKSRVASNLWHYAIKSATIMFRAGRDYKPFYFIGVPGLIIFLLGAIVGAFVLIHYLNTGQTSPYRSLVTGSGTLVIIGFLLLFISMLADMLHRNRVLLEELLYMSRKREYSDQYETQETD